MTPEKPRPGDTQPIPAGRHNPSLTQPSRKSSDLSDTQPGATRAVKPLRSQGEGDGPSSGVGKTPSRGRILIRLLTLGTIFFFVFFAGALGGAAGGQRSLDASATAVSRAYLEEQYQLGLLDIQQGNLELARQRFEFIFTHDQSFAAAADRWVELSLLMNSTATVTPPAAAPTPTPTQDPRPKEELFTQATLLIAASQWDQALDVLSSLRQADTGYRVVEVDGMIYLALRNRGVDKILRRGELESGMYDFSLAEQFGPLDAEAGVYRGWARLYLQGNSFWMAYPDIAAIYYGQVAAAAPNLRDESGLTAFYRYFASLVQYADQLAAAQDWCAAAEQYGVALRAANNTEVAATATVVSQNCFGQTPTVTATSTHTPSSTVTGVVPTTPAGPSSTPTSTATPENTAAPGATDTPTPTSSPTFESPSETPSSTATPMPSDTPVPTETETPSG
ncbi:MAG: hypothetical protein EPO32_01065 [Anaerolineae bacterium]|nr:MAG: hypothetical protein EPO32_01065 [Anaerolineae bacterium]